MYIFLYVLIAFLVVIWLELQALAENTRTDGISAMIGILWPVFAILGVGALAFYVIPKWAAKKLYKFYQKRKEN